MDLFNSTLRSRQRSLGAVLAAAGLTTLIAACGAGQIAQTDQASAVNGTEGTVGEVALRDVRIQAVQSTGDFLKPGRTVDLLFVASNQSADSSDELTGISTDVGKVALAGDKKLPAGGVLVVGAPVSQDLAPTPALGAARDSGATGTAAATVTLDKPITNGLTYDFTFDFKQAGQISLAVPISAGVPVHR